MAKVKWPLMSVDAMGRVGKEMIFRRGGVVTRYFRPKNPRSVAQEVHRQAFKEYWMAALTQAIADLLYAAIGHDHDEDYASLDHVHALEFPIGFVYLSVVADNPSVLLGYGEWEVLAPGKTIVCIDPEDSDFENVGDTGGAKTHTLTTAEMPAHTHTMYGRDSSSAGTAARCVNANSGTGSVKDNPTGSSGSGGAHNNLQPYFVVYMWKRTA